MYPLKKMADFLGDRVVYRNLIPCDDSLPKLADVWEEIGLDSFRVPRKTEMFYAQVVYRFLQVAQEQRGLPPLERIVVIGDTLRNDGGAAKNLGTMLPMRGFIAGEKPLEAQKISFEEGLMLANRWSALRDFEQWLNTEGFAVDERTAVLLDLDKTTVGARGRNDNVIDQARITAVRLIVEQLLGGDFDEAAFRETYDRLNQAEYHSFTADNQDYLAYISLMVVGQIYPFEQFWADLESGRLSGLQQFVTLCDGKQSRMSDGLLKAHLEVTGNLKKGDPTPFKSFRYREYHATVSLMNKLSQETPLEKLLAEEIVLTGEVAELTLQMVAQGALSFGVSDKPDEASLPRGDEGLPLHHIPLKTVGELPG